MASAASRPGLSPRLDRVVAALEGGSGERRAVTVQDHRRIVAQGEVEGDAVAAADETTAHGGREKISADVEPADWCDVDLIPGNGDRVVATLSTRTRQGNDVAGM